MQPVEGVAMDASQETSVAELIDFDVGCKAASQDETICFDHAHAAVDVLGVEAQAFAQTLGADGAAGFGPAPDQARAGVFAVFDTVESALRRVDFRLDDGVRVEQAHELEVFGGEVEAYTRTCSIAVDFSSVPFFAELRINEFGDPRLFCVRSSA